MISYCYWKTLLEDLRTIFCLPVEALQALCSSFVDLSLADSSAFLKELNEVDFLMTGQFAEKYKVRRNKEKFWPFYDWLINGSVRIW